MEKVTRREFMGKGGKYALFTGTAMQVLLTSKRALAYAGKVIRGEASLSPFKCQMANRE